jgi:regulator of sigma E protease
LTTILATIFVLGVLVFFHELGHFLVAKRAGIRVEKFSLGFPPTLISKRWGETEYAIGIIPLGGYVKMAGENPGEETRGEPWEFMSKPVWKRFLVIFAGPFMNFLLAVLVLAGIYYFRGVEVNAVYINSVIAGGPAEKAGIRPGDMIVSAEGEKIESFVQLADIINKKVQEPLVITWQRGDRLFTDTIVTAREFSRSSSGDSVAIGIIGITPKYVYRQLGIAGALATGFDRSVFYVEKVIEFVWGLLNRTNEPKNIGGPIFIARLAGTTARAGFDILLEFLAILSVNLAVLNIMPIPVFDGGHLVFLLIEKLKGSPLSLKARMVAQQIGFAFIIILVLFVTFNDITR